MEALQAASAVCQIVEYAAGYVTAYATFPEEAERLQMSLSVELLWLKNLKVYLNGTLDRSDPSSQVFRNLPLADQQIIIKIRDYMGKLEVKAQKVEENLRLQGKRRQLTRVRWLIVRSDIQELANEIMWWRQRLGIQLLNLPERAKTLYDLDADHERVPSRGSATTVFGVEQRYASQGAVSSPNIISPGSNSTLETLDTVDSSAATLGAGGPPKLPSASGSTPLASQTFNWQGSSMLVSSHAAAAVQMKLRISRYNALSVDRKHALAEKLYLDNITERFSVPVQTDSRRAFALLDGKQVLLEFKSYDPILLKQPQYPPEFHALLEKIGCLSAELNNVDSVTTNLLQCVGFFNDTASCRLGTALLLPAQVDIREPVRSLEDIILLERKGANGTRRRLSIYHSLNDRFLFARRIVTSVCFFHSFDWVHKDITSSNSIVIQPYDPDNIGQIDDDVTDEDLASLAKTDPKYSRIPYSLGHPYLVAFEKAREDSKDTDPRDPNERWVWQANIYRHPAVQYGIKTPQKHTTKHDLYSLGVVLLELGLWESLAKKYESKLSKLREKDLTKALIKIAREDLPPLVGQRYAAAVIRCLEDNIPADDAGAIMRCLNEVLDDMEELSSYTR
ncbi:hypothetical protein ABW19_dt0205691 [Dactylella cylindrospora]|nr:hypothetical protein ABW19_dt0205691 [Dactylella cylindrospora]